MPYLLRTGNASVDQVAAQVGYSDGVTLRALFPNPDGELLPGMFVRGRLPEGQRTVFQLRHFGCLPLAEVAETLDLALPTVKTQFARACLRLQSALAPHRPQEL